jgi:hypothetical protein
MSYPLLYLAQVAELVDALASGVSGRKVVEVRVFSWAPSGNTGFSAGFSARLAPALAPD